MKERKYSVYRKVWYYAFGFPLFYKLEFIKDVVSKEQAQGLKNGDKKKIII